MKRYLIFALCLALLAAGYIFFRPKVESDRPEASTEAPVVSAQALSVEEPSFDEQLVLRVQRDGTVQELPLKEYLIGVLLAEMPTEFPMEALKAQAIASRTFALKQAEGEKHSNAHICADSSCCQGWEDSAEFDAAAVSRASKAVEETDGLVLTYEGKLIDATFFSCSGGQTEAAVAVWGADVPYLQSVDSPGEEEAPRFTETVCMEAEAFAQAILSAYPEANLSGSPVSWLGAVSYTQGGGIDTVFIGGVGVKGTALRSLFGLRSTDISIETSQDQILFTTCGFGHRVGLSQYGAMAMAEEGCSFEEILLHYYQHTEIKKLLLQKEEQLCFWNYTTAV